jgi:hypothetical protein
VNKNDRFSLADQLGNILANSGKVNPLRAAHFYDNHVSSKQ